MNEENNLITELQIVFTAPDGSTINSAVDDFTGSPIEVGVPSGSLSPKLTTVELYVLTLVSGATAIDNNDNGRPVSEGDTVKIKIDKTYINPDYSFSITVTSKDGSSKRVYLFDLEEGP